MNNQLKTRQICLFIIAFFPIVKIFIMPSFIAQSANEDLWISALINILLDAVTLFFIVWTYKKTKQSFFEILESVFGKIGAKIIAVLYFIVFMLKVIVPLNEQKDYVELTLYTLMPSKYYFLPMFAVAFFLCCKKLRVLGRASDILWFFTILGMGLLIFLALPNSDFGAILPIGANGFSNIIKGSYKTLLWHGDVIYLLFFIGQFKFNKKDGLKIFLSFVVSSVIIIIFLIIFYAVFTSIAFRQRFALTEISKYSAVINNIGRFDYLGIVLILFSNVFALSLPLFFSCRILNYVCGFSRQWIAPCIVVFTQFAIMIIFKQFYASIENLILSYGGILFILFANVFPAILPFICKKELKNENDA